MNVAAVTETPKNSDLKKLTEKFLSAPLSCQEFTLCLCYSTQCPARMASQNHQKPERCKDSPCNILV